MRKFLLTSSALLLTAGAAVAQVTVDPRALDALKPESAAPATPPKSAPAKPRQPARAAPAKPAPAKPQVAAPVPPPPAPPPPVVPAAPPPPPVIPPPVAVPTRPVPPPTPAVVTADAPGEASAIVGGIRITFGTNRTDLNPATSEALRGLASYASGSPNSVFNVTAYAAGTPEDPSSPRRLSLGRALTVRSMLISQGFASPRIYVKALGATTPAFAEGPPDRVDITVTGMSQPAAGQSGQTPPVPAASRPDASPAAPSTQAKPAL